MEKEIDRDVKTDTNNKLITQNKLNTAFKGTIIFRSIY